MKNIVWEMPGGNLAVYNLPENANSQAAAIALKANGQVDADWIAAAFDVQSFPGAAQAAWRMDGGAVVPDPALIFAEYKAKEMATFRAMRLDLLDVLTGIGFRAMALNQADVVESAADFQQALLDLPGLPSVQNAPNATALKNAMRVAYDNMVNGAHPTILTEWDKVKP